MHSVPGISWGLDNHINLMRSSIGWLAVYYDTPKSTPEIIQVFTLKDYVDYYKMIKTVTLYNYNTCKLCPLVKADIDATS